MTLSLADRTQVISVFNSIGDLQLTPKQIHASATASANMPAILKYIYQKHRIDTTDFMAQNFVPPAQTSKNKQFIMRSIQELNENYEWGITPDLISQQISHCKTLSQCLIVLGREIPADPTFPLLAHNIKRLTAQESKFASEMYQVFLLSPTAKKIEHRAFDCGYAYRADLADPSLGEIGIDSHFPSDAAALSYAQAIIMALNSNHYAQLENQCKNGAFTQNQFILAILDTDALSVLFRISAAIEMKLFPLETICENPAYIQIARRFDLTEQEKCLLVKVEMIPQTYHFYEEQYKKFFTPNSWNVPRP
jgi:hypothetical protein